MVFINEILTFPGRLGANFLSDHFKIFSFMFFGLMIILFAFGLLYKKKEYLHIVLILTSVLLTFIPFTFQFASYRSKLFWATITLSAAIGFVYYFIDKKNNGITTFNYLEPDKHDNISDSQEQLVMHPLDRIMRVLRRNSWLALAIFIFILAFYLRTFQIEKYPAGYSWHELFVPVDLTKYDEGKLGIKSYLSLFNINPGWHPLSQQVNSANQSPIVMAFAFPFYKIFGISMVTTRYFSVLCGMAGLLFLFLYLREHFPLKIVIFLSSFTALELINVIFARTGFIFITSFVYTAFVLYFLETTFKQRKLYFSVPLAFLLGLFVFGSNYVYLPTKAVMLIVFLILGYKTFFKKEFLVQNIIPLVIFSLTFSLAVYFYTQGHITKLWPSYGNSEYVNLGQNVSALEFVKTFTNSLEKQFETAFNKIVFIDRAGDSLSKFKEGGLVSGPTLCFIPFALGFVLAGFRREIYFSIIVTILVASLPALLGPPSARRLLLTLSMGFILSGITVYLLFDQIEKVVPKKLRRFSVLIPGTFFLFLFSYNLYIFIDINNNMQKTPFAAIPYADAGWHDITYSKASTIIAKKVKEFIKYNNVFFYYSDGPSENYANSMGTYEKLLIEGYENIKKGGKLVWMNPFRWLWWMWWSPSENEFYFNKFEKALKMVLDSDRDVKVIFIKPLADEKIIYEKLKNFFSRSIAEEQTGDTENDKFYVLSIPHSEIDQIKRRQLVFSDITLNKFDGKTISHLIKENVNSDFSFTSYFLLENDSKILFQNNVTGLFEITIDHYKLNEQPKYLTLLKGVHSVKITAADRELFSAMDTDTGKTQEFSAPLIPPYKALKIKNGEPGEFYPYQWSLKKSVSYNQSSSPHAFYYDKQGQYVYALYERLYNRSDQLLNPDNKNRIIKLLKKEDKIYMIHSYGWGFDPGFLGIYDLNYKKIKEIPLDGYPFDLFFGSNGELYITYLNREIITIIQSDYSAETWDTTSFSMLPIWNGDTDKNGDIILLSGSGQVFVFNKNREMNNSFSVDASWNVNHDLIRFAGGLVVNHGVIHIFDSGENLIRSYSKSGQPLYHPLELSLFKVPSNFKIYFMQRLGDEIILAGRSEIQIYQYDEKKVEQNSTAMSLLKFEPSEVSVGYYKYSINSGLGLLQTVNNEKYDNFIFAHAPSHATYHLRGLFQSLLIGYGLDDVDGKDLGSVKFVIKGDGKLLYTSKVIRALDTIENVKINIKGIDNLELIVDPTQDGNSFDQSVWINPILQMQP